MTIDNESGNHSFGIDITKDITPASGYTISDLVQIFIFGADPDKIKQNNWRRLHGLPMKRRK